MTEQTILIMRSEVIILLKYLYSYFYIVSETLWNSNTILTKRLVLLKIFRIENKLPDQLLAQFLFYKLIWIFRDDLENCSSTSKGGQICMLYNSNKKDFLKEHKSISYSFPIWSHALLVFTKVRHIFIVGLWIYLS